MKKLYFLVSIVMAQMTYNSHYCTVFAHGIIDGPGQIHRFESCIKTDDKTAVSFPDADLPNTKDFNALISYCCNKMGKKVNRSAMFMGQGDDIRAIEQTIAQNPTKKIILYGCSRGAAALVTYLAQHNPQNIAAVVLDACPTSMPEAIHGKLATLGIPATYSTSIFSTLFPSYHPATAVTPMDAIAQIKNKNIPILLIHAKTDAVVPYQHSLRLYQQLRDQGFTNVHVALIESGRHSYLLQNDQIAPKYQQAVHSFYKKYGLPHEAELAKQPLLETELNAAEIAHICQKYQDQLSCTQKQAQRKLCYGAVMLTTVAYFATQHNQYVSFWQSYLQ